MALGGLALAMLAADGKAEIKKAAVFTTHLDHLRNDLKTEELSREG